ncbi:MAG: serine/threonine protein kinase [Myxococcota bacterium]|nr:serine/threonine protein kinase [Myxococcota bacterium]
MAEIRRATLVDSRQLDGLSPTCFAFHAVSTVSAPPPLPDVRAPDSGPRTALERLGPYELLFELASGGMATVFLARATDRRTGPPLVAVKRPHRHLTNDKTFLTMLVDEARLASAIDHENVVKVRELGFDGGIPFIIMDYVEGASLAELRRELSCIGRAIDVRVAVRIVLDALAGLHAAHELEDASGKRLRIIHRDVSPHNVLIGCDGRAHITDFGIAKAEDRIQTTRTHEVKGKLAYLAPERVDKRRMCTVQSDVFSMAVVLWECFAGRRLFRGEEPVDVLQEVMSGPIPMLRQIGAQLSPALDDVVARALSRDLETRYPTALAFAEAIEQEAGPDQIGTHADVAKLMEAIFGARMALRQEQVRATIGSGDLTNVLRELGLPARERVSITEVPTGQLLAKLAPPAPSGRYALGAELRTDRPNRYRRVAWWTSAAVAAGIVFGALVTLALVARHPKSVPIPVSGVSPTTAMGGIPVATVRRVVVPLPFAATHVTFDDAARDMDPPTDLIAFDVPVESGPRHRVTALGLDGTRAEGYVRELDGITRPDADGYALTSPSEATSSDPRRDVPSLRSPRAIGKVHNGFTKLK